jgi:hypothetical protein
MTAAEKLEHIWQAMKYVDWTFGEFLYHASVYREDGVKVKKDMGISGAVALFLKGTTTYCPGQIIFEWFKSPYGNEGSWVKRETFNMDKPWEKIGPIRECLRAFAGQTVRKAVAREAEDAVTPRPPDLDKSTNCLHV